MQDLVLVAITSQLTDDRLLTIERDDCVDGTLPQTSLVKPAKLFTIHSTIVLEKICALRSEKLQAVLRAAGLRGRVVRIYRANPGVHRFFGQQPNRLWKRHAKRRDQIWVGDLTYVAVAGRWRYLAVVMDQYSRRILSWSLGRTRTTRLTRVVLDRAVRDRQPARALLFHSDRGSEYAGAAFRDRLQALGIRQSMTRGGSPGENAHGESFFHSLEADVIHGVRFTNEVELRRDVQSDVRYYNHQRLHSGLGYRSPIDYERRGA